MAVSTSLPEVVVEGYIFPAAIKAAGGADKSFFLGGAGVRGKEEDGKFVKFTVVGTYLEDDAAVPALNTKWRGKNVDELMSSDEFFCDLISAPFEKIMQVTILGDLTSKRYSEQVAWRCSETWKAMGAYDDEQAKVIDQFLGAFKDVEFSPGRTILYTQSPLGSLTISFSKHGSIPESGGVVINNKLMSEAIMRNFFTISPAVKKSLVNRLSQLLNN